MMVFMGLVSVACIALIAFVVSTASTIGAFEILMISVFGFVGLVSALAFTVMAVAIYTKKKVKTGVDNIADRIKRFRRK